MDFFESQDVARRKTSLLVGYYVLAVALIIAGVYLAFAVIFLGAKARSGDSIEVSQLWNPTLAMWVMGGTLAVVLIGSLSKIAQLSSGGEAVARMLGGKLIDPGATDPQQRKVLNIVEEMSIASGVPVPPVFMLEDDSINAFAAGLSPSNAVIGVTRGSVEQLSRDELQGVMAHEFSHILNGDMRLNIRLIGVLHGILVIALIGYGIVRTTAGARHRSRSSSNKEGGNLPIVVLGLVLMAVGYIGVFFGKLIKSAVSRQREFLADASAVQFTRNPQGIGGALRKIGGWAGGSRISSSHAEEASHFFFANGLRSSLIGLMATHPPLEERINRIDASLLENVDGEAAQGSPVAAAEAAGVSGMASFAVQPDRVVASVGAPGADHLAYAHRLLERLPAVVSEAIHTPVGAMAVIYTLLLDRKEEVRGRQREYLRTHASGNVLAVMDSLRDAVSALGPAYRLPVADMSVVALRGLSADDYGVFSENVRSLVQADRQVDLFEYALRRMLKRSLAPVFEKGSSTPIRHRTLESVRKACGSLLSSLAYWGADEVGGAERAFRAGAERLGGALTLAPLEECGLDSVDGALDRLVEATHAIRKDVLDACVHCVASDRRVTVEEAELIRAVADALECPMPPLFGQV